MASTLLDLTTGTCGCAIGSKVDAANHSTTLLAGQLNRETLAGIATLQQSRGWIQLSNSHFRIGKPSGKARVLSMKLR